MTWEECRKLVSNAQREARRWTWIRAAAAHKRVYEVVAAGRAQQLRVAGDPRYAELKQLSRWDNHNRKPGIDEQVLQTVKGLLTPGIELTVWNSGLAERAALAEHRPLRLVMTTEAANLTLESAPTMLESSGQMLILSGLEFCLKPELALAGLNELQAGNLIIGFYQGPKVRGQTARFDDQEEVRSILGCYMLCDSRRIGHMVLTRWTRESNTECKESTNTEEVWYGAVC